MTDSTKQTNDHIAHQQKMRQILGLSVIVVSAVIILLWGFAFRNRLTDFSWKGSAEQMLVSNAQANWQAAQAIAERKSQTTDEINEKVRATLSAILSENLSNTLNASTTASGTNLIFNKPTTTVNH